MSAQHLQKMAFRLALIIAVSIFVQIHISSAKPADADAQDAQPAQAPPPPQKTDTAKSDQTPAPPPPPALDCKLFVGTNERKMKPGCEICWTPPEKIKCEKGDWQFATCGAGMKCVHTSECTTSCVEKPPTTPRPKPTQPPTAATVAAEQPTPAGNMTKA